MEVAAGVEFTSTARAARGRSCSVHGFLTNALLWRNVVAPLAAAGHRCIAPDWPLGSHRRPMPADADLSPWDLAALIARFLEELDLRDVVLVGNDTGGALAQMVVARHPERVGALVLTPCDAFSNWPAWWSKPLRPIGRSDRLMWLAGKDLLAALPRVPAAAARLRVGLQASPAPRGVALVGRAGPGRCAHPPRLRQGLRRHAPVADARGRARAAVVLQAGDGRVVHRAGAHLSGPARAPARGAAGRSPGVGGRLVRLRPRGPARAVGGADREFVDGID